MFYIKMTILNDFSVDQGSASQPKWSVYLNSFYVSYSRLSVTNIAKMAMFYIKMTILNDFPIEEVPVSPTGQFK